MVRKVRRKTSKEILAESFHELVEKKPADRITVQEITENCGYSPATFYRQFRDKYDLIAWDYSSHCSGIMDRTGNSGKTWKTAVQEGCSYLYSQRKYLCNVLKHTGGQDSFFQYMSRVNAELLEKEVLNQTGQKELPEHLAIGIKLYAYGTSQVICEWLGGKWDFSAEHLSALFIQALPEILVPYLNKEQR